MYLKNIFLIIFLTYIYNGFAQSTESNLEFESQKGFSYGIELIKNNKIEASDKFFRKYINAQNLINEKVKSCYKIAITYNNNLYYNMSLEYALEGINYLNTSTYLLTELNHVIIINHLDLKNYNLAESYYLKVAQIHPKKKSVEANEFNLIGEIHRLKKNYDKSIVFYHKAIKINQAESYKESLAINYNNIGLSHLYLKHIDSATYYLNKSITLIDDLQLINRKSAINISFGELYLKKGNYSKALDFFKKTITFDLSNHPDQYEVYQDAYKGMKNCYELIGDYKNALNSYVKFQEYNSKIINYEQNASILQNQIISERKVHFRELNLINSKLELEKKYKNITFLVLGTILSIIILIIYILWITNKRIKQKIELELNKNIIQELEIDKMKLSQERLKFELIQTKQSQQIKKLERICLEEQIESKNRELTSTAIHLMSKNEILNQIQEKISNKNINIPIKTYKDINFLIADSLRLDEDWDVFKKHFTDVHPDFFEKLKLRYSDITTDELKLCAFLKIQLSSKEIARLINITVAAVNKRRNRLRKKLQIDANQDFYEFFIGK